jgi:hypothetical protein
MLTNHLAPMLFTLTLLPLLKETALDDKWNVRLNDVRIVNVNSTSHMDAPATSRYQTHGDFNDPCSHDENGEQYARYAHTKLANALFSFALQQRLNAERVPIIVTYPHQGAICTVSDAGYRPGNEHVLEDRYLSAVEGALTPIFCAVSSRILEEEWMWKGKFVMPFGGIKMGNPRVGEMALWTECWKGSIELIEKVLGVIEKTEPIEGTRSKVRSRVKNAKNNFSMALMLSRSSNGVQSKKRFLRDTWSTRAALQRFRSSDLCKKSMPLFASNRTTSSASRPRLTSSNLAIHNQTCSQPAT